MGMRKFKAAIFYSGMMGIFSLLIYIVIQFGTDLESGKNIIIPQNNQSQWMEFIYSLVRNLKHPLGILLAQIITIILVARLFSWLCKKIGQPAVIGEILAGIVLGPSLIGLYFPEVSEHLFPVESLGNLQFLSQIGLIFFMYMVGMELDMSTIRRKAHDAVVISQVSIIVPFALGMGLAYFLYTEFAGESMQFTSFALFVGIAMSITAFPVLARIVQERGIHKTKLGAVVITCAAVDDITAWCLLAAVIAIVKAGSFISSLYVILLSVSYVVLMIKVVRPFLKRVGDLHPSRENLSKPMVAIFFVVLLISAYATEIIGIHALFGAFMAGTIMPDNMKFRNIIIEKVEDVALILLLPLFFVYTGLRTEVGLINDPHLWAITGLIILVAIVGKFIGSAVAARYVGQNWEDSLTIGALMNTRGLMELVVLNIGYDLGVLTPKIFAMMVIMALVTTFMTGPLLDMIKFIFRKKHTQSVNYIQEHKQYKILISFANPSRGRKLLKLAHSMVKKQKQMASVTVMHLSPDNELNQYNIDEYEKESFAPLVEESIHLKQKIITLFKVSSSIEAEISDVANKGGYDLLLVGLGQSIFEGTLLGRILGFSTRVINPDRLISKFTGKEKVFEQMPFEDRTKMILTRTSNAVGVLVDKDYKSCDSIVIPFLHPNDAFILSYAQKLIVNSGAHVTLLDVNNTVSRYPAVNEAITELTQAHQLLFKVMPSKGIQPDFWQQFDLVLVSIESWKVFIDSEHPWIYQFQSLLILKDRFPEVGQE